MASLPGTSPAHLEAQPLARPRPPRAAAAAILLAALLLWTFAALRYQQQSAVPLGPTLLVLRVGLLTLGHYLIGSSVVWLLARRERLGPEAWAWCILLGSGTLPAVLWIADQLGHRAAGWLVLALLVLGGQILALSRLTRRRASPSPPSAPGFLSQALTPLTLLLCLAAAAVVGMDHIVYLRPGPQGVVLTPPEDNLVHTAFALEWTRQEPFRHLMQAFTPEQVGIPYHYLTDVQISAWWTLAGGDHLDFVHRERFLLQGLSFLIGLYLLARAILESRPWALVSVGLFAALPFWFLDIDGVPQRESLQRLWTSFTFQSGAAFGAGFLACLWAWLFRGQAGFARIAVALAGMLLLAKVYFAVLAWAAACALVVYLRPRAWVWWIAGLALLGVGLVALQPHGADILGLRPEWAPGRFWTNLFENAAQGARDDRGLSTFVEWIEVGLGILGVGALCAGIALRSGWPSLEPGRALVVLIGASWGTFLAYSCLFWFLDAHQTVFQFLPWLALVSILAGLAGSRLALQHWLAARRTLRIGLACAGIALWGLVLARASAETAGFTKIQWTSFSFTRDSWETLRFLRTQTPQTSRVLAPFESPLPGAQTSPYAVSGIAGRRAVNEHSGLGIWLPGLAERIALRKQQVGQFYLDPRADRLRELAAAWKLDYAVLPASWAQRMPVELGWSVFSTPQWSVIQLRSP